MTAGLPDPARGVRYAKTGEPTHSGIARATMFNLAGFLVPVIVQLVTVPLYLRVIGTDRYGVMALVWLLLGYFGFFDLGFGRAIASRIAALASASDAERADVFWTGTCLSVVTGMIGSVILYVVAACVFRNIFAVPANLVKETDSALPLIALALPLITGISALSGALQGRESFGAMNFSQMTGSILYQVFPIIMAYSVSIHLPGLVAAAIAGRLVTAVMLLAYCVKQVPARGLPRISRRDIAPLLRYGGWVTVTGLISPLLTVFDRFVVGTIAGMTAVTAYTIPYNLVMRIAALPSSLQNALFPRFAMVSETDARELQRQAIRLIACLMTPLLMIAVLLMRPFLNLWVGTGLANAASPVGQVLMIGLWANMLAFIPFSFLQSRGRPDLPAKFHAAELVFYIPLLYLATRHFGIIGAAWSWDARTLLDAILLLGAVDLLRHVVSCWFGAFVLSAAFVLAWYDKTVSPAYVLFGGILLFAALVWSAIILPADMRHGILARLRILRRPVIVRL